VTIQDKLSMAITLQTINHKLQAIHELMDDIHKMDNTSNVPCRKTVEEFGISVSTLNNSYAKLRHNSQSLQEHMSQKQNDKSRTWESKIDTGLGNETGKLQNIKKNRHVNCLSIYWP